MHERVRLVNGKARVCDSRPIEDSLLDTMLHDLADQSDREAITIIRGAGPTYLDQALVDLAVKQVLYLIPASRLLRKHYEFREEQPLLEARSLALEGLGDPQGCPSRPAYLAGLVSLLRFDSEIASELKFRERRKVREALVTRLWPLRALQTAWDIATPTQETYAPGMRSGGGIY